MPPPTVRRFPGFTLIELLAVIAIITVLLVAVVPAVTGIKGGLDAGNATVRLAAFLEQARQYATANNTYVYVSLLAQPDSGQQTELWAAAAASNAGTDLSAGGTASFVIGGSALNARQFGPVLKLSGFVAVSKDAVSTTVVPRPTPDDSTGILQSTAANPNGLPTFGPVLGKSFPISFWFGPDGSASNNSVVPTRLEMVIVPLNKANTALSSAWASDIQIAGLTGTVRVYRSR